MSSYSSLGRETLNARHRSTSAKFQEVFLNEPCPHIFTVRNICLRSSRCLKLQRYISPKDGAQKETRTLMLHCYTGCPIHIHSKRTIPVSRCSCAVCRFRVSTRICTSGNKRSFFTETWCPSSTCRNYRAYLFPIQQ